MSIKDSKKEANRVLEMKIPTSQLKVSQGTGANTSGLIYVNNNSVDKLSPSDIGRDDL